MKKPLLTVLAMCMLTGMALRADDVLVDSWDVEIIKTSTNEVVMSETVPVNSFALNGLERNTEYIARIRTCNQFLSGWSVTAPFVYGVVSYVRPAGIEAEQEPAFTMWSADGVLFISTETEKQLTIYSIDGCLVRTLLAQAGETRVEGLRNGFYLVNNQKVIIK